MNQVITHQETDYLLVKAPLAGMCAGCVFENANSSECPRDKAGHNVCYEAHDGPIHDDKILIFDTDDALADYVTKTLEGTWEIEVEQENDGEHE